MIFFKKNESETVEKIKFRRFSRVFQLLLWGLLILVLARGVMSYIKPDNTGSVKAYMQDDLEKQKQKIAKEFEASAFAEGFSRAFMEYSGDDDSYKKGLTKYVSPNILTVNKKMDTNVLYVKSYKNTWVDENKLLVDCEVTVAYKETTKPKNSSTQGTEQQSSQTQSTGEQDTNSSTEQSNSNSGVSTTSVQTATTDGDKKNSLAKNIFLRVPISIKKDGGYIIESYPTFISSDSKSSQNNSQTVVLGEKVDSSEEIKVKEVAKSFLSAYCEGKETDLEYYMLKSTNRLKGLGNNFRFVDIDKFDLRKKDNKYNVNVMYKIEDSTGEFPQQMQFVMIYKDGKYVIESLNTIIK